MTAVDRQESEKFYPRPVRVSVETVKELWIGLCRLSEDDFGAVSASLET